MTFNVQSLCSAILVCLDYPVHLTLLEEKEGVFAGWVPCCLWVRKGSIWPVGDEECFPVRCFLWWDPICKVCLGEGGHSWAWKGRRTLLLVDFCQWGTWSVPHTSSASPSIVDKSLFQITERMRLSELPSVPTSCGLGNPKSQIPSSIGWGGPKVPCYSVDLWT